MERDAGSRAAEDAAEDAWARAAARQFQAQHQGGPGFPAQRTSEGTSPSGRNSEDGPEADSRPPGLPRPSAEREYGAPPLLSKGRRAKGSGKGSTNSSAIAAIKQMPTFKNTTPAWGSHFFKWAAALDINQCKRLIDTFRRGVDASEGSEAWTDIYVLSQEMSVLFARACPAYSAQKLDRPALEVLRTERTRDNKVPAALRLVDAGIGHGLPDAAEPRQPEEGKEMDVEGEEGDETGLMQRIPEVL